MTGAGHRIMGALAMVAGYHVLQGTSVSPLLGAAGIMLGANAPDYLEIRYQQGKTVIPHRTLTHWLPLWLMLLLFSWSQLTPFLPTLSVGVDPSIASLLVGFALGGLLHLLLDFPNPMGIPVLTPFHRWSLNWWRSGTAERPLIALSLFALVGYLLIHYQWWTPPASVF